MIPAKIQPAAIHPAASRCALTLWRAGRNTADIAKTLAISESVVCRAIHAEQDRRYRERIRTSA